MGIIESTIKELIKPCECLSHVKVKCRSPCCNQCCDDGCECLVDTTTPSVKEDIDDERFGRSSRNTSDYEGNISSSPLKIFTHII